MVVHLDSSDLLDHYVVFSVGIDESLVARVELSDLPRNCRADPAPIKTREVGDLWAAAGTSVVLQVPSAVLPAEHIFLLNPRHPDFSTLVIGSPSPFRFDRGLAR